MSAARILKICNISFFCILLSSCVNMPTPPSQITPAYSSSIEYEQYNCDRLATELNNLSRRENSLVVAQSQRIKTSEMQAFWFGYGQGDGIEAAELANVRGEKTAVRDAMAVKNCRIAASRPESTSMASSTKPRE